MDFHSSTIAKTLPGINESIFLPAIQREFVWDTDQVVQLFDSVLRGYPIGSFLFWEVRDEYADQQIKYEFIRNYIEHSTHPSTYEDPKFENVHHHNPKLPDDRSVPDTLTLVLDGQQRLTSFLIGLKGTYTEKQYRRQRKNPDAWDRKKLYLNVLSDPETVSEDELKLRYDFQFKKEDPDHSANAYWYEVGDILDVDDVTNEIIRITDRIEAERGDPVDSSRIMKNLNELYRAIHEKNIITYQQEDREDDERVLDIFIRANEGGTQLSKSEILLSIATAHWANPGSADDGIDARKEITNFVEKLNSDFEEHNFDFEIDFVLKSLLVLSGLPAEYRIQNFTAENLDTMRDVWQEGTAKEAIHKAIELIEEFGLDGKSLTSYNAIIPIAYYYYANDNRSLNWSDSSDRRTRSRIHYWLSSALLNSSFNSRPDQLLEGAREAIDDAPARSFPIEEIHRDWRSYGKKIGFEPEDIDELLEDIDYTSRKAYLLLSLLYYPDPANHIRYEIDHAFPQKRLDMETLIEEYSMDPGEARQIADLQHHMANLQLLTPDENARKGDMLFSEWMDTVGADGSTGDYHERHRVPPDTELYKLSNFPEFIEERKQSMREKLVRIVERVHSTADVTA